MFNFLKRDKKKSNILSGEEVKKIYEDAITAYASGDYLLTLQLNKQILEVPYLTPQHFILAHYRINYCYNQLKDYESVISNCDKLLNEQLYTVDLKDILFSEHRNNARYISECWLDKGKALHHLEKLKDEIETFDKLFTTFFASPDGFVHINLATALLHKGLALSILDNPKCTEVFDLLILTYGTNGLTFNSGISHEYIEEQIQASVQLAKKHKQYFLETSS